MKITAAQLGLLIFWPAPPTPAEDFMFAALILLGQHFRHNPELN